MNSTNKKARIAGIFYILMGITGVFGMIYVPSQIIDFNDPVITAENVKQSEMLFRLGVLSQILCQTLFIFLAWSLYQLLKDVNNSQARLLVWLVVAAVPVAFIAALNQLAALMVVNGIDFLKDFTAGQQNGIMMAFLKTNQLGINIALVFWGLWLFPFGYLVYQSGFFPKILGIFLMIGGAAYLVDFITAILFPNSMDSVSKITMIPAMLGEFPIMLWLLIMGAKDSSNK